MKITVLLFGILKDIIERNSIELIVEEGVNIEYLKGLILKNHGKLIDYSNFSIAVNEDYVDLNYRLKNNDVVALIPPVSGG
jgi:molybdopterin converting factor small subunit